MIEEDGKLGAMASHETTDEGKQPWGKRRQYDQVRTSTD